jgi:hypothetical protein
MGVSVGASVGGNQIMVGVSEAAGVMSIGDRLGGV